MKVGEQLSKAKSALEESWLTVFVFAGGCWDTLDEIEEAVGAITGEASADVGKRIYRKHKRFVDSQLKNRHRTVPDRLRDVLKESSL